MNQAEQANYKTKEGLSLGDRMKSFEKVTRNYLISKMPVIIRIDGKAFHSYCKQKWVKGPFDDIIIKTFQQTTLKVCESVQNIKFAYHQSDEVTFFLKDYDDIKTQQHFNGNIQKISSTVTSEFTYWFNFFVKENLPSLLDKPIKPAFFDCRVFNVPVHEVVNNFIWRQRDAIKNSITGFASTEYSHKELNEKNSHMKINMMMEKGKDWNKIPLHYQRGSSFYQVEVEIPIKEMPEEVIKMYINKGKEVPELIIRKRWICDMKSPIFSEQKEFIEKFV